MLRELFPDIPNFVESHWHPSQSVVTHGPLERLTQISGVSDVVPYEKLLGNHRGPVYGCARDAQGEFVPKEVRSLEVAASQAGDGATLHIQHPSLSIRALRDTCEALLEELESPLITLNDCVFYSESGGTPRHADTYDLFALQLSGSKRWTYEPGVGTALPTPVTPWLVNEGYEDHRHFSDQAMSVVLRPGSVLFLPRGYWHATEVVDGPSLGLTIGCEKTAPLGREMMGMLIQSVRESAQKERGWEEAARMKGRTVSPPDDSSDS